MSKIGCLKVAKLGVTLPLLSLLSLFKIAISLIKRKVISCVIKYKLNSYLLEAGSVNLQTHLYLCRQSEILFYSFFFLLNPSIVREHCHFIFV